MPVLIHFVDGQEVELDVDEARWASAFESALTKSEVVQIKDPADGGTLGINPRLVLYWKIGPDS